MLNNVGNKVEESFTMTSLAFPSQWTRHTHYFTGSPTSKMKMGLGGRPGMAGAKGYNVIFKHIKCNPSFQYCCNKSYHTTHLIKQIEITINNKENVTYAWNESREPQVTVLKFVQSVLPANACKCLGITSRSPCPPPPPPY